MRLMILMLALSLPVSAQVYQWTDENGVTHFGSQPPPGKQKPVTVKPSSGVSAPVAPAESDIIRQARELERRKRAERAESAQKRYRQEVREIESRIENRPDYICTNAENRLKSAEERWHAQKVQGYTLSEQRRHEQVIRDRQRHRDNVCR